MLNSVQHLFWRQNIDSLPALCRQAGEMPLYAMSKMALKAAAQNALIRNDWMYF